MNCLVEAGLNNEEALISATRLPSEWLEIDQIAGTVEVGKCTDLVLLDANPLEYFKNTRTINGVFVNGTWLDKEQLEKMLYDLEKWNLSNKEKYKWNNRRKY